jgi:hypothetical protein
MYHVWGGQEYIEVFGGKAGRKGSLGTPRHRWEGNIKMNLREI